MPSLRKPPMVILALSAMVGLPVIGMIARQPILQSFLPGRVGMKPLAAVILALVIAGLLAQARHARWMVTAAGLTISGLGAIALGEFVLGADFGTGRLFRPDHLRLETPMPGRIAPPTAIAFIALGMVFLLLPFRGVALMRIRRLLLALVLLISMAALIGFLYGAGRIRGMSRATPIAMPTAIALMLAALAAGTLDGGEEWPWCLWHGGETTARVSRFLIPSIILIPVVAGALRLWGEDRGWFGPELGTGLVVLFHIIALMAVVLWALTRLRESEGIQRGYQETVSERTEELQATNRELEAFSYSVSHDLRAPLRAIEGYARILEEDYAPLLAGDGQRYLGVVRSETRRMGVLIDDLLAFSQVGRKSLVPVPLDLAALSREIVEELQRSHRERTVDLRIGDLPAAAGDRTTIRQVLVNLLSNALKYSTTTREGPIVIEISGKTDDGENVYTIRDHGVGFDMRYVDKLFGVFQRLHSADEFEGTGVGLAIVERIIARHGGRVWAEGQVGEGATFSFALPVVAANNFATATESLQKTA